MILPSKDVTSIKIRECVNVYIAHIPHDLTKEEADKINRVIMALVNTDSESGKP